MQDISEDVILRAARGESDAFEQILKAYGEVVYNVSLRVVRHKEDAEEVAQEVFLTLYRKLRGFEGRSSLKTWIYRITVNTAINFAKRAARMKDKTVGYDETNEPADAHSEAQERTEGEYAGKVVDRLLQMLSEEQRACIVLRNVEGLSYEEIAGALGININAVRSRLKRARERLLAVKEEVMADEL